MSKFIFDANLYTMKYSIVVMKNLASETECMINKTIDDYQSSCGPKMHVVELDHGVSEEYYSYKEYYNRNFEDIDEMYMYTLPYLMRRSAFLTIYGMFEYNISKYCTTLIESIKFPLKLSDLARGTIEKSDVFLTKIIGMKKINNRDNDNLKSITQIRHLFTHMDGVVSPEDKKIKSAIEKLSKITDKNIISTENNSVSLGDNFLLFSISVIEKYFNEIERSVYYYMKSNR